MMEGMVGSWSKAVKEKLWNGSGRVNRIVAAGTPTDQPLKVDRLYNRLCFAFPPFSGSPNSWGDFENVRVFRLKWLWGLNLN